MSFQISRNSLSLISIKNTFYLFLVALGSTSILVYLQVYDLQALAKVKTKDCTKIAESHPVNRSRGPTRKAQVERKRKHSR
jgi:hypothetical protein